MQKKHIYISSLLCLTLVPTITNAESIHELNQKRHSVEQNLEKVKSNKSEKEQQLNLIVEEINQLESQFKTLNEELLTTRNKVQKIETDINILEKKIANLRSSILLKEKELKSKENEIAETLRLMHSRGKVSMLEFLFRSDSLSEFINRYEAYKKITESQEKIYNEAMDVLKDIEESKIELEQKETKMKIDQDNLLKEKEELVSKKQEISSTKASMEQHEFTLKEQLQLDQVIIDQLTQENEDIEIQMALEKQRIEDEKNNIITASNHVPVITGNDVVDIAYKWVKHRGKGSSNPVSYSMPKRQLDLVSYGDCSSFTRRVFLDAGKGDIGLTTAQQVSSSRGYFSTNLQELKPGDLMYFGPTGNHRYSITLPNGQTSAVSHVTIYVGNNKMIDLSSSVGTIAIKDITTGSQWGKYVQSRFIGFKRF